MAKPKIILTDYPKPKGIEANYRGMETDELLKLRDTMFHLMMPCWSSEVFGGWVANYEPEGIDEELKFRNVELSKSGCNCKGAWKGSKR